METPQSADLTILFIYPISPIENERPNKNPFPPIYKCKKTLISCNAKSRNSRLMEVIRTSRSI